MNFIKSRFISQNSPIRLNTLTLILFEVIYKIIGLFTLYPALFYFSYRTYRVVEGEVSLLDQTLYLTQELNIAFLVLTVILLAIALVYEISVIVVALSYSKRGRQLKFGELLKKGLLTGYNYLRPVNWGGLILSLIFIPVFNSLFDLRILKILYKAELGVYPYANEAIIITILVLIALTIVLLVLFSFSYVLFYECGVNFLTSTFLGFKSFGERPFTRVWGILKSLLKIAACAVLGFVAVAVLGVVVFFICYLFNQGSTEGLVIEEFISYVTPLFILFFLVTSVLSTVYYFRSVYGLLYGEQEVIGEYKAKRGTLIAASGLCLIFALFGSAFTTGRINSDNYKIIEKGAIVVGHRGNMKKETDNTGASYLSAIANGGDYVELDVYRTKDGVLVASHDNNLVRQTGRTIRITESTYDEIKDLTLRDDWRKTTPDQKILTLSEALNLLKGKAKINVELIMDYNEPDYAEQVVKTIIESGAKDDCVISSTSETRIDQVKAIDNSINVVLVANELPENLITSGADAYSLKDTIIDSNTVKEIHALGKPVYAWALGDEESFGRMSEAGVDYFISNDVALGRDYVDSNQPSFLEQILRSYQLIFNIILD